MLLIQQNTVIRTNYDGTYIINVKRAVWDIFDNGSFKTGYVQIGTIKYHVSKAYDSNTWYG